MGNSDMYREDIEALREEVISSPLYFHSECHPKEPTWAKYSIDGTLIIECSECSSEIARIVVASIRGKML